jgi:Tol biopolymer transport system component
MMQVRAGVRHRRPRQEVASVRMRLLVIGCLALSALLLSGVAQGSFTELVSVNSTEVQADQDSVVRVGLSTDGRLVVFECSDDRLSNVVTAGADGPYVYVRDRVAGTTERADVQSDGTGWAGGGTDPCMTPDGRYVAFASPAILVSEDPECGTNIFVHDRLTGVTERVSVNSAGEPQAGGIPCDPEMDPYTTSCLPAISADGRYVAFLSNAANLLEGDTNGVCDVFVHDRVTGTTQRVNLSNSGGQVATIKRKLRVAISPDGRYLAFESESENLVDGDTNGCVDVFVRDLVAQTTTRESVNGAGEQGNGSSAFSECFSADSRYLAFSSGSTNLVEGDTNNVVDVFVRDRVTGTVERVSVNSSGEQGNEWSPAYTVSLSSDGRYVAFNSEASNLVESDTNVLMDVFRHDRLTGKTERMSVNSAGEQSGTEWDLGAAISGDGLSVAFFSDLTNLVEGDTNDCIDVFVRDLRAFRDVLSSYWAYDAILACAGAGIVSGFTDGSYRPAAEVTRDQMAVYMARALCGGDAYVPTGAHAVTFTDVPAAHWAFRYVEYCYDAAVVQGYGDGYRPTETVNRAQMAVYVARAIVDPTGETGLADYTPPTTASFPDVATDYWAYKHVEYCKAAGVVNGYWDGTYGPENVVTRDQMAVYVARAFGLM